MSRRVAIVDDHFLFAEAVAGAVRDMPECEVAGIAVTGPQAVSLARDSDPDVILLDYHVPGYEGDDLIRRLREASPRSRIVVVTSDPTEASRDKAEQAGATAYVTKDRAIDDLEGAIREAVSSVEPSPSPAEPDALTPRELEILGFLSDGNDVTAIAERLVLSVHTVRTHVQNVLEKLGAHSQLEALALARRRHLIH